MSAKPSVVWIAVPRPPDVGPPKEVVVSVVACPRLPTNDRSRPGRLKDWPKFLKEKVKSLSIVFGGADVPASCDLAGAPSCRDATGPVTANDRCVFTFTKKDLDDGAFKLFRTELWDAMAKDLPQLSALAGDEDVLTADGRAAGVHDVPSLRDAGFHSYPAREVASHLLRQRDRAIADRAVALRAAATDLPLVRTLQRVREESEFWRELYWEQWAGEPAQTPPVLDREAERRLYRASSDPQGDSPNTSAGPGMVEQYRIRRDVQERIRDLANRKTPSLQESFLGLATYLRRTGRSRSPTLPPVKVVSANKTETAAALDLDQRISLMRTYPAVLRPLGLVMDITLPVTPKFLDSWSRASGSAAKFVWACVELDGTDVVTAPTPRTLYVLSKDAAVFSADDSSGGCTAKMTGRMDWLTPGYARLDDGDPDSPTPFALLTVDQDGGAMATLSAAALKGRDPAAYAIVERRSEEWLSFYGAVGVGELLTEQGLADGKVEADLARWSSSALQVLKGKRLRRLVEAGPETPTRILVGSSRSLLVSVAPGDASSGSPYVRVRLEDPDRPRTEPPQSDLPPFRGAGLTLVRDLLKEELKQEIIAAENSIGKSVDLCARDLVCGLVPYVWARNPICPAQAGWFSVGARVERYIGGPAAGVAAETVLRLPAPTRALDETGSGPAPAEVLLPETVFQYSGYHLGSPANRKPPPDWCPIVVESAGTLPPLRFAPKVPLNEQDSNFAHRVALATVDVAGHHVSPTRRLPSLATDTLPATLRRHDPVGPPQLVATLRTGDACTTRRRMDTLVVADRTCDAERWVVPPRVPRSFVETYSLLDDLSLSRTGGMDALELVYGEDVTWPNSPLSPDAGRERDDWRVTWPRSTPPPGDGSPFFYPDPAAWGFRITVRPIDGLGSSPPLEQVVPWYDGSCWPKARPWRLRARPARAGQSPMLIPLPRPRVLLVLVPLGWQLNVQLASVLGPGGEGDLPLTQFDFYSRMSRPDLAVTRRLEEVAAETIVPLANGSTSPFVAKYVGEAREQFSKVLAQATASATTSIIDDLVLGRNETLTPFGSVRVVCAAPEALAAPVVGMRGLTPDPDTVPASARGTVTVPIGGHVEQGDPADVHFDAYATLDSKSTDRIELHAQWSEPQDDPSGPFEWRRHASEADTFPIDVIVGPDSTTFEISPVHHLGRTKHLAVDYFLRARNRLLEEHRTVSPEIDESAALPGPSVRVHVLNRRSPPQPCAAYAVPAFRWDPSTEEVSGPPFWRFRNARHGNRVRIYLERGWFATGEDELLGILVPDGQRDANILALEAPLSTWSRDPLRQPGNTPISRLSASNFEGHVEFRRRARLPSDLRLNPSLADGEAHETGVAVLGFQPQLDPDRGLWFVDVTFRGVPEDGLFVRLSMVRFQPWSVRGCDLSEHVLLDYSQLLPDRALVVLREANETHCLRVHVTSTLPTATTAGLASREVLVNVIVPACEPDGGEVGWIDDPTASIEAEQPRPQDGLLWTGRVRLRDYRRPRVLVVREPHRFPKDPGQQFPYFDMVEL